MTGSEGTCLQQRSASGPCILSLNFLCFSLFCIQLTSTREHVPRRGLLASANRDLSPYPMDTPWKKRKDYTIFPLPPINGNFRHTATVFLHWSSIYTSMFYSLVSLSDWINIKLKHEQIISIEKIIHWLVYKTHNATRDYNIVVVVVWNHSLTTENNLSINHVAISRWHHHKSPTHHRFMSTKKALTTTAKSFPSFVIYKASSSLLCTRPQQSSRPENRSNSENLTIISINWELFHQNMFFVLSSFHCIKYREAIAIIISHLRKVFIFSIPWISHCDSCYFIFRWELILLVRMHRFCSSPNFPRGWISERLSSKPCFPQRGILPLFFPFAAERPCFGVVQANGQNSVVWQDFSVFPSFLGEHIGGWFLLNAESSRLFA